MFNLDFDTTLHYIRDCLIKSKFVLNNQKHIILCKLQKYKQRMYSFLFR